MRILTKVEAEAVTKYYSEIIIGKPILKPGNFNPYPIQLLEINQLKEDEYAVYCFSKYTGKVMRRSLDEVIPDLDVLPLEEFLSNLNQ